MPERIKLPLITAFRINGFEPLYSKDVALTLDGGPYVVLGGNGLGKTTLMQAIIFGLSGPLDDQVESIKSLRWNHTYFRGRLAPESVNKAVVEVDFQLGDAQLSVRRGLRPNSILAVREGNGKWIQKDTDDVFSKLIRTHGGYLTASDFAFVVHHLLYLPENRRLIAWNTEAQVRLLMLLNQDVVSEHDFREKRTQLKELDSRKRHIHVALGKANEQLEASLENELNKSAVEDPKSAEPNKELDRDGFLRLVKQLRTFGESRLDADNRVRESTAKLHEVSSRIEKLRLQVEEAEAALVAGFIREAEDSHQLAISKLLRNAICPACGRRHGNLAERARHFLQEHRCVLCGTDENHQLDPKLDEARDQLERYLRDQQGYEQVVRLARTEAETLRRRELIVQDQVNRIRFRRSADVLLERHLPELSTASIRATKNRLERDEAEIELQIKELQDDLDRSYSVFRRKVDRRMDELRNAYIRYSTEFLGLPCSLEEVTQAGLMELKLFVPMFNGSIRPEKESCSEAQRFFLDIAFRMSLIDLACGAEGTGTFLCETPETALDFSYVDNVVGMFAEFASRQHNLILTANAQDYGIAEKLLARVKPASRISRIINLIAIGQLSGVQKRAIKQFDKAYQRLLKVPYIKK